MATTENLYVGDGSTVLFSFTFPYLKTTDIKVSLDGVDTTAYSLANATTVQFNTAPTSGAAIRIYRITDATQLAAQFYPGSAIRSQDLNDNFTQNLYATQESNRDAAQATTTANAATVTANNALSIVNSVVSYDFVANVPSIPSTPADGDRIEILDSTGIQSFTPLTGLPSGFNGASNLSVRLVYDGPNTTWDWVDYSPTDPDARYLRLNGGTISLRLIGSTSGYVEINAPAVAGSTSIILPATSGEAIVKAANGSVDLGSVGIDSSGRLLVGTSTAYGNGLLQIQGEAGDSTGAGFIALRRGLSDASIGNGTALGAVNFAGNGTGIGASISASTDAGTWGSGYRPSRLVFSVTADGASSPTERMRIGSIGYLKASNTGAYTDSGGNNRVNTPHHQFRNDQNNLTVLATNTNTGAGVENFTSDLAAGATGYHFIGAVNLGRVFLVAANGNVQNTNNSYGAISDIKLKENIVDANSQWGDIKALQVRNYNFKEGQTHTQIGLIAQEVEQVSPGLVTESPDRDEDGNDLGTVTKSVNYSVLYMKAVKALQEAMERIETLETEMAAVKAQLA